MHCHIPTSTDQPPGFFYFNETAKLAFCYLITGSEYLSSSSSTLYGTGGDSLQCASTGGSGPYFSAVANKSAGVLVAYHKLGNYNSLHSLNGLNGTIKNKLCPIQAPSRHHGNVIHAHNATLSRLRISLPSQEPGGWSHGYAGLPSDPLA
ncbi:hypothetical protein BDV19DRAFT_316756 [Aspergillus venezuelensis]